MAALKKTDVLFAHIALHVAPGLSASARRVGSAIIGHFNRRTGQCDPTLERLATLLGIDRATVVRATAELCGQDGMFERITHGGRSGRTAYLPRWELLNDIVDDWDLRMKDGSAPNNGAKLHLRTAQKCAVDRRKNAPQTFRRNLLKEPKEPSREKKGPSTAGDLTGPEPTVPSQRKGMFGLGSEGAQTGRQCFLVHALPGGKAASKADAAEGARWRRITEEINRLPQDKREAAWLRVGEDR